MTTSAPCGVREARAEDVEAIVPLMHESSRALIDFSFAGSGHDPRAVLRRDFLGGAGLFGHRHQIVAVEGHRVVATMTVYRGGQATALTLRTALAAARELGLLGFGRFVARSLAIARLFAPPRRDALFLANACVDASRRGRGLFSKLLAHVLARAEREGVAAIELDVSFDNDHARAAYEHLGFRVTGERPHRGAHAIAGFRRMALALRSRD